MYRDKGNPKNGTFWAFLGFSGVPRGYPPGGPLFDYRDPLWGSPGPDFGTRFRDPFKGVPVFGFPKTRESDTKLAGKKTTKAKIGGRRAGRAARRFSLWLYPLRGRFIGVGYL